MRFKPETPLGQTRDLLGQLEELQKARQPDEVEDVTQGSVKVVLEGTVEEPSIEYSVQKSNDELRYTLGPLYSPNTADAHDEFTTTDELRKAVWDYTDRGDNAIRKQHGKEMIGQVREIMQWPTEIETEVTEASTGEVRKEKFPAGTVFMGVQWSKEAWPLVKQGKIRGYSLGGRAVRVRDQVIA